MKLIFFPASPGTVLGEDGFVFLLQGSAVASGSQCGAGLGLGLGSRRGLGGASHPFKHQHERKAPELVLPRN